jgi:hypothetical protein
MATALALPNPVSVSEVDARPSPQTSENRLRLEFTDVQRSTEVSEALFAGPRGDHAIYEVTLMTLACGDDLQDDGDVDIKLHWFVMRQGNAAMDGQAQFLVPVEALDAFAQLFARVVDRARRLGDVPSAATTRRVSRRRNR